ncbi:Ig-like domain-containing protein [bacterium 210702-DFI.5.13]|nr:Ig-like domain-containing protein [bacterium 210702-DFI.5.13]
MNKTKTRTGLSALFAVLLAIMIAVPAIFQSGANAAVNRKRPTKVTLTSAKAISYNKVSLKWKKSKNITSYAVYYKASDSKKWVKIANVSSKKTGYTHKSSKKYPLKQGKTYQYRIRGYNKKAKGNKKLGKYSSVKKVKVPKKPAAKPTEAPKPTVKPTEVPKPTAAPKPTVTPKPTAVPKPTAAPKPTVTPIPKPTAIPKPTQIPQPTKPVQPAKPTATPIPKPTAVPQPTATPKPVKVSSITLNQTSLTLTSKGQTASLTATVSPANAANKSLTWSSSNSSVVTVNANGTVTAIANGTADITATAADGSGVSAKCSVTVRVPNNVRNITLEGGKSKTIGPDIDDFDNIDFKQVTFDIKNDNKSIEIAGFNATEYAAGVTIEGLRKGYAIIIAKYNGAVLLTYNVTIASDWQEYLGYVSWRHTVESKIWTDGMSLKDKMDTARDFIKTNYDYKNGSGAAVYVYNDKTLDCHSATEIMGDFAKDAGANVKYSNTTTGLYYDYFADSKAGRHTFNVIFIDGAWAPYDASPLP